MHEYIVTTHDVEKETFFDDENFIVAQGTEPNRLIANTAGLEAFVHNDDAASSKDGQNQAWVAVPERQGKARSLKVLFR
jgi:hypothetical protein